MKQLIFNGLDELLKEEATLSFEKDREGLYVVSLEYFSEKNLLIFISFSLQNGSLYSLRVRVILLFRQTLQLYLLLCPVPL